jgi:hypothetical protein
LVLGGLGSMSECEHLSTALDAPVLPAPSIGARAETRGRRLEFPCRFDVLERQMAAALGRDVPLRPDCHPELGVTVDSLLYALSPVDAKLFELFLEYQGAPVPNPVLLRRGFGATVSEESRDRGVRRLREKLRYIAIDLERNGSGCWRWTL